jgi:hypothetical protein
MREIQKRRKRLPALLRFVQVVTARLYGGGDRFAPIAITRAAPGAKASRSGPGRSKAGASNGSFREGLSRARSGSAIGTHGGARWLVARLVASTNPQLRPVLLRDEDRCLPFAGQVLEAVGIEQRLVERAALLRRHVTQRRVGDDLSDAAAQLGARHWRRVDRAGLLGGRCRIETPIAPPGQAGLCLDGVRRSAECGNVEVAVCAHPVEERCDPDLPFG